MDRFPLDRLTGNLFADRELDAYGDDFSEDHQYRYRLWRIWDQEKPIYNFCMLNPSSATWDKLDPTCKRVQSFVQAWGGGGMVVTNCFALVDTNPEDLYSHPNPVGPRNDQAILFAGKRATHVVLAWGNHAQLKARADQVYRLLASVKESLHCLQITDAGEPGHPLYLPADTSLAPYRRGPVRRVRASP